MIALPHGKLWKSKPKADSERNSSEMRDAHDVAIEADETEIQELNACLTVLVELFPDIQPAVFREMLIHLGPDSRLELVTDQLLKERTQWVKGRIRARAGQTGEAGKNEREQQSAEAHDIDLPQEETFRSESYKSAVRTALTQEFKSLSKSSIHAVLAEFNYSYFRTRSTLIDIASRSWRYSALNFFTGRKPSTTVEIPLIILSSNPDGTSQPPSQRLTASTELNREIYQAVIAPIEHQQKRDLEAKDKQYARELNEAQAEEEGALYECQCCYTSTTFESLSLCSSTGHETCSRCIRHAVNQALFGQNWATTIAPERMTVRCIASTSGECRGVIDADGVKKALLEEANGEDIWHMFEDRITSESLVKSQMPLIICPFCIYAEPDPVGHIKPIWAPPAILQNIVMLCLATVVYLWHPFGSVAPFLLLCFLFILIPHDPLATIYGAITASRIARARRRRGLKFICHNPRCHARSCIECKARWKDPHTCYESESTSLRIAIERAKADAIKRTCPMCHMSFVKASGCNKMKCTCGYTMCYVCRQHISTKDGYSHFCNHFQAVPGSKCTSCDKCHMYKIEDEEMAVKNAAEKAETEWRARAGKVGQKVEIGESRKNWSFEGVISKVTEKFAKA